MDKIAFARLIAYIASLRPELWLDIEEIDKLTTNIPIKVTKASVEEVDELLRRMHTGTQKIEAIKAYRALTGEGLLDSKNAVEKYWTKPQAPVVADISHVKMINDEFKKRMITSINNGNNMLVESLNNRQINALIDFIHSFDNPITSM